MPASIRCCPIIPTTCNRTGGKKTSLNRKLDYRGDMVNGSVAVSLHEDVGLILKPCAHMKVSLGKILNPKFLLMLHH